MRRRVRMSIIALSAVLVLLTMQTGVDAKKKSSKRKQRTARSSAVVITPPVLTPTVEDDTLVSTGAATRVTPSSQPTRTGGMTTDSAGDSGSGGKRSKGRVTIGPLQPTVTTAGVLLISEFRVRGPSGASDEYIEIYNNSGADHTVAAISGTGYGIAASDGVVRCTIPNGTVIPAGGHFLCVNNTAFSLSSYRAGAGSVGSGDAQYSNAVGGEIPDNAGIALFNNNSGGAFFQLANRFDAAGSTSEADTLYKEGTGYPTLTPFSINYAWVRDTCGKGGSITTGGFCTISTPKDTDDNATDFYFVDTNGTSAGAGQRLGAPGPESLSSPIQRNSTISAALLDATVASSSAPNRVRDFTSVPANNSTFGTISIRRRFVNNTGASITRLRFRVVDLTTFPAPSGFADLRGVTSSAVVVAGINDAATCTAAGQSTPCSVTVEGSHVEGYGAGEVPSSPNGAGYNNSFSADTITLGTPLANGASIDLQFLLGIQQTGSFRIYVNIETLP